MKTVVIMNEQHSLMEEQEEILNKFNAFEILKVPKEGWTLNEMCNITKKFNIGSLYTEKTNIIFVSPVPALLKMVSLEIGQALQNGVATVECFVFHNDNRIKKELPNKKTINIVSKTGWKLV